MIRIRTRWLLAALVPFLLPATAWAALNLEVEAGPDPAQPGESLRVAITVSNPGSAASGTVTLRMPYPANLASVDEEFVSDGGDCPSFSCDATETVVWSLGTLAPGEGATVTMAPSVLSGAADGAPIVFDVEAFENGTLRDTTTREIRVLGARIFDLSVDEDKDPVGTGETMIYEINYGNRSAETTTGTRLLFRLAPGTLFEAASDGGLLIGSRVEWNLGTLAGHEGGRRTLRVRVGLGQDDGAILHATRVEIDGQGDFLAHQSRMTAATRVENGTRLLLGMALNPDPARPGEILNAAITVTNPTNAFVQNVLLRLRFPRGLASHDESLISDGGNCSSFSCDNREELFWNLGTLPPGRGVTVSLAPRVAAVAGGTLITFPMAVEADGLSRVLARESLIVRDARIFDLAVDIERSPVAAGGFQTYTLVYGNRSAETTTGTTLSVPVPLRTTLIKASDGGVLQGNRVTWNLGTLAGGEGGQRQVRVRVGSGVGEGEQLVVDPAFIRGQGSFFEHVSRARSRARVENDTRLDLALAVERDPVMPGERQSVRIAISNRSAIDFANNVVVQVRYPAGLASLDESLIISGNCDSFSCEAPERIFFNLGDIPPGGGTVVELPPAVSAGAPSGSVISLPVLVDATDRARSRAGHSVLVRQTRALDLAIDVDADPLDGATFYTLTVGNRSNDSISDTSLRVPVPAGMRAISASNGGQPASGAGLLGDAVVWNFGTLAAGRTRRVRLRLDVVPSLIEGNLLRAFDAELRGQGPFFEHRTRARDARRNEDVSSLVAIAAAPEPVLPNQTLNTTLEVTNGAPSFLFGTTLQLRFPEPFLSLDEDAISDGGNCDSFSCDEAELITWALGDLPPGAVTDVMLPPVVSSSTPRGSLVRLWAHLFADTFGQAVATLAIPVGDDFTDAGNLQRLFLFANGFENGNTTAWSSTVP